MGRPTKLTPERQQAICDALRSGNTRKAAAAYGGIDEHTLHNWLNTGGAAKQGLFFQFFQSVARAEADFEVRNVALIQTAAKEHDVTVTERTVLPNGTIREKTTVRRESDWQAAAWLLERRRHKDWRQRKDIDVRNLTDDQVLELIAQLDEDAAGEGSPAAPAAADAAEVGSQA